MTPRFDPQLLPARPDLSFERPLWDAGLARVGGVDEAGRGAWAGPVAAGVVILPCTSGIADRLEGVRDSKQMTPAQRTRWAEQIRAAALDWGVGFASPGEIDGLGILPATRLAVRRALACLAAPVEYLLVDFLVLPEVRVPQRPLIKGDARSLSIAAASVLAKTARDALLVEMEGEYPGYSFACHKGYGTRAHQAALAALGPTPAHRKSFAPVRACLERFPPAD
ncbi:MAG TPA: ribonuclease HII [Anaerolineaceae bacterium]